MLGTRGWSAAWAGASPCPAANGQPPPAGSHRTRARRAAVRAGAPCAPRRAAGAALGCTRTGQAHAGRAMQARAPREPRTTLFTSACHGSSWSPVAYQPITSRRGNTCLSAGAPCTRAAGVGAACTRAAQAHARTRARAWRVPCTHIAPACAPGSPSPRPPRPARPACRRSRTSCSNRWCGPPGFPAARPARGTAPRA